MANEQGEIFRDFDLAGLGPETVYRLLTSIVIPRPIAFVTTLGPSGLTNAAPFSSFVTLALDPPIVGIVVGGDGRTKDTLRNIRETSEFVINSVSERMADLVQNSAEPFPSKTSEIEALGIAVLPAVRVAPPRILDSPIHLECRLSRIVPFGRAPDLLIAGEVVHIHIHDGIMADYKVDPAAWSPLGRIGGRRYCRVREFIDAGPV